MIRSSRLFSRVELRFVEKHKALPRRELYAAFVERFERTDITVEKLRDLCKRNGWLSGRWKPPISYSRAELCFIKKRKTMNRRSLHRLFVETFCRHDVTLFNLEDLLHREHWRGTHGKMREGSKDIGSERMLPGGFVAIKVRHHKKYVLKHHWMWKQQNGPIPTGHKLKCRDGNKLNCEPSNWECVPSGVIARLNKRHFDNAPPELKPTIIAVSKLEHLAFAPRRTARQPRD